MGSQNIRRLREPFELMSDLALEVGRKAGAAGREARGGAPPARPVRVGDRIAGGGHEGHLPRQPRVQAARPDLRRSHRCLGTNNRLGD